MSRSYRGIILAIGLILSAPNHAYAEGSAKKPDTQQSIADSLRQISSRYDEQAERAKGSDQQEAPCGEGEYGSNADLCAQWKAADAAADSAWWAWAAGVAGIISTLGVLAALGIGWHSNWIARDTAKRQLRAYVSVVGCSLEDIDGRYILSAHLKNSGQTPAYNVRLSGESFAASYPLDEERPHPEIEEGYNATVGPGDEVSCVYRLWINAPMEALRRVKAGEMGFYIQGICEYEDAFAARRETKFRYVFGGRVANTGGLIMHAAESGNSAT